MKRVVSLLLIVCAIICFAGCSNPQNAKWEGYDKMPFKEFLKKGIEGLYEDHGDKCSVTVTVKDSWEGLSAGTLEVSDGAKPVTYIADVKFYDGETVTYYFYMELDKKLSAMGAKSIELGHISTAIAGDTYAFLNELKQYVD